MIPEIGISKLFLLYYRLKIVIAVYKSILNKETHLAVIGLGYVGLPIALEFAKKIKVVGFDINSKRVEMMKNKIDPSGELNSGDFDNCDIEFI